MALSMSSGFSLWKCASTTRMLRSTTCSGVNLVVVTVPPPVGSSAPTVGDICDNSKRLRRGQSAPSRSGVRGVRDGVDGVERAQSDGLVLLEVLVDSAGGRARVPGAKRRQQVLM